MRRPGGKAFLDKGQLVSRPQDRSALRLGIQGLDTGQASGMQGGGERGEEEGWGGEPRLELARQSPGLEFILLLCAEWIVCD